MIMLKDIGADPVPNYTRDIKGHCPLGRLPLCPDPMHPQNSRRAASSFQPPGRR
jgi:hypothetical protein